MGKNSIVGTTKRERAKITAFIEQLKETSATINQAVRDLAVFTQETEKLEDVSGRVGVYTTKAVEGIIKRIQITRTNMNKLQTTSPEIVATLQLVIQRAEE
ncbi:hypothetical protein HYX11_04570 [Candidatus Woesearchaeota archaeon]|nr:hypothetical protein [Candidatus Woesearchaeota archaeon]